MATLSLKNINKIYPNRVQAVFDFNLHIKDKEFIVFVGPSGCGKSTTLRMVAGLEDISSGELLIDGKFVNTVAPKDRDIAMVFQNYALYPHMTVYGNLRFALKLRKIPMPIYEKNENIEPLLSKRKEIRNKIKNWEKKFKKNQNDLSLLAPRAELYKDLYANDEEIQKQLVPVKGIDNRKIESILKSIKQLEKEIKYYDKLYQKHKDKHESEVHFLIASNENRKEQIKKFNEEIEYLSNNEVELTEYRHLTKHEMDIEINKVSESIDLVRYLFRKPSALSGGQRQRVALGRAIVRKPKVFLMDEPLSNLDAKLRVQTRSEISKIHKSVGATTIYVTHDQTEAMTMADRIVVMKDGVIQQIGTPDEVYSDPANKFVASFIGSPAMNFINTKLIDGSLLATTVENETVGNKEFIYKLNAANNRLLANAKDVILGIRPEDVVLVEEGTRNNQNMIDVVCDYVELLGFEYVIYTYICGQKVIFKAKKDRKIKEGDIVKISFPQEKLFFFDSSNEERIKK